MSIIIAGSTGAIGKEAVIAAVRNERITRIVALTRQSLKSAQTGANDSDEELQKQEQAWKALFGKELDVARAMEKVVVQQFDWEAFTVFWEANREEIARSATSKEQDRVAQEKVKRVEGRGHSGDSTSAITDISMSEDFKKYKGIFAGHQFAAMCMGTTRSDAGSAKNFWRVDVEYARAFAEAVSHFNCSAVTAAAGTEIDMHKQFQCYAHVSSQNSNPNSSFLYIKAKGQSDEDARAQQFPKVSIYQPGLLHRKEKARFMEKLATCIAPSLPVQTCGEAIIVDMLAATAPQLKPKQITQLGNGLGQAYIFYNADIRKRATDRTS